jgi:putative membrane protein
MKHLIRTFLFNVFALWLTSQILPALVAPGGWQTMLFAGFVLSVLMIIVAPVLKILFIPINILTFGLLSWLINVIVIYLLTFFVPEIQVKSWLFPGFSWSGFIVPSIQLSYILSLIVTSFCISIIADILHYVSEE